MEWRGDPELLLFFLPVTPGSWDHCYMIPRLICLLSQFLTVGGKKCKHLRHCTDILSARRGTGEGEKLVSVILRPEGH